jgi:Putative sensor
MSTGARAALDDSRLPLYPNPLRLAWSASPWRAAGFLTVYLLGSWVLFSVAFTVATTAAVFAITLAGIPLLAGAAGVIRSCADVERRRLRQVFTEPVHGEYRQVTVPGVMARARVRWRDPATWRDLAYLVGLWAPLTILDTVAVCVWVTFLAGVTAPIWYWAPESTFSNGLVAHGIQLGYFPNGPHGPGGHGLYVDTLPKALLTAAASLILFLLFNYVLVATARAHACAARALLRPPADPLAPARAVLASPGPLRSMTPPPNGPSQVPHQA